MANRFEFRSGTTSHREYKPVVEGHKTFLIHLGSCIKPAQRTQFNIHILKDGYNYTDQEIIDFWMKVKIINENEKEQRKQLLCYCS